MIGGAVAVAGTSPVAGLAGSTGSTTLVLVVLLLALGAAMLLTAVWLVRSTRTDAPALAPLEVMGDRSWSKADGDDRSAKLTAVRPEGALPPAPMIPVDDDEGEPDSAAVEPVPDESAVEPVVDEPAGREPVPDEPAVEPVPDEPAVEPVPDEPRLTSRRPRSLPRRTASGTVATMATLDVDQMLARFRDRAAAVKHRPLPPVAGEERQQFIAQANVDFQDFSIVGDAEGAIEDGVLVLRIDLRPPA